MRMSALQTAPKEVGNLLYGVRSLNNGETRYISAKDNNHGVIRQDQQRWYFNTNSGTIYFQKASLTILIHITFMLIDIIWCYS